MKFAERSIDPNAERGNESRRSVPVARLHRGFKMPRQVPWRGRMKVRQRSRKSVGGVGQFGAISLSSAVRQRRPKTRKLLLEDRHEFPTELATSGDLPAEPGGVDRPARRDGLHDFKESI